MFSCAGRTTFFGGMMSGGFGVGRFDDVQSKRILEIKLLVVCELQAS
jgi:hypothetical protein